MILAIDIDNKTSKFGAFSEGKLIESFSIMTDTGKSIDETKLTIKLILLDKGMSFDDIEEIIISSVVPEMLASYKDIAKSITGKNPILISSGVKTSINIKCESPKEVGSDRIIRAVGAINQYDTNLIVISAASITTIDFINEKKEFLGGLILPGIDLMQVSLNRESAKLPQVEIKSSENILGKNTVSSIQSGIYHGYKNAVAGIVNQLMNQYRLNDQNTRIITTGDFGKFLEDKDYKYIPNLGLMGLNMIYELNKK